MVESGAPVLQRYGVSDDDAFAVGLTCGGILDVFVEKVNQQTFPELGEIAADIEAGRPVALATVIEHPDPAWLGRRVVVRPEAVSGSLGSDRATAAVSDDALGLLASGHSATLTYGPDGERRGEGMRVFVWAFAPAPRMLVFGAIDFAAAVARVGEFLGYHVTVCDARPVFATNTRFPHADEVVVSWPHKYLKAESEAGPDRPPHGHLRAHPRPEVRRTRARAGAAAARGRLRRRDGLATHPRRPAGRGSREAGVTEDELARLSSPIGLDLGARTPEETAVSIAAEIIAGRWGGTGDRLSATDGRIHAHAPRSSRTCGEPVHRA